MKMEYLCNSESDYAKPHFNAILVDLNESINELREVSHNLQSSVIGSKGLKNTIADFIDSLQLNISNQIAEKLNLSHYTIETHRKNIVRKTGAKNSAGLVKYAMDNNIQF